MSQAGKHTQNDDTSPNNIPDWTLGDRLRKARRHANLQAIELAERIGVSANTIGNAENDRGVTRRTLVGWSWATGVPIDWLEHGDQPVQDAEDRRQEKKPQGRQNRRAVGGRTSPGSLSGWRMDNPILVHPNLLGGTTPPQGSRATARNRRVPLTGVHTLSTNGTTSATGLARAR